MLNFLSFHVKVLCIESLFEIGLVSFHCDSSYYTQQLLLKNLQWVSHINSYFIKLFYICRFSQHFGPCWPKKQRGWSLTVEMGLGQK